VGAKYVFMIPPELGYGENGMPPKIPGNVSLVFLVELLEVTRRVELPDFVVPDAAACQKSESGLLHEVLAVGEGDTVRTTDWVTLHYSLWLKDGSELHSTHMAGEPQKRPVTAMPLPGLSEGIQQMRAGGRSRFIVPAALAYGEQGIAGLVPPNSEVVCEVELFEIERGPEPLPTPEFKLPGESEVTTTDTGLKFEMLKVGDGATPGPTDAVTAHYVGWLTDGTVFDNSFERGEPAVFPLDRVIAGWTEGLQLMRAGGEAIFVIAPELGYGATGAGQLIPPDATLVFLVQLISVEG
jgi:FKBP-type peptidyl-prolyl cis-trans isomerase